MFRGKRIDNGAWVDGCYMTDEQDLSKAYIGHIFGTDGNGMFIHDMDIVRVVPETVCQYTGMDDKNGKKIFEWDIVEDKHGNLYKAFWQENYYQFSFICIKTENSFMKDAKWDLWSLAKNDALSLCGNVFDNPELVRNDA